MFMIQSGSSPNYPVYDYLLINEIDGNSSEKLIEKPIEKLDKKLHKKFNEKLKEKYIEKLDDNFNEKLKQCGLVV